MALSRLKQGFESPRERQSPQQEPKKPALCGLFCFPGLQWLRSGWSLWRPPAIGLSRWGHPGQDTP
ncbi:hypothetical protein BN1263190046 [Stenotrophomonas maltophilia]|nr:hypothetical protein BN1263190046 [Stenotrophomonas maltophilia]